MVDKIFYFCILSKFTPGCNFQTRQLKVLGVSEAKKEVEEIVEQVKNVEPDVLVVKHSTNGKVTDHVN